MGRLPLLVRSTFTRHPPLFGLSVEANLEPTRAYLAGKGYPVFSEGERYGADGNGYSMYLRDPEGNVIELKCSASAAGDA